MISKATCGAYLTFRSASPSCFFSFISSSLLYHLQTPQIASFLMTQQQRPPPPGGGTKSSKKRIHKQEQIENISIRYQSGISVKTRYRCEWFQRRWTWSRKWWLGTWHWRGILWYTWFCLVLSEDMSDKYRKLWGECAYHCNFERNFH